MEAALGADFSDVRVHVGPQAEQIGALAFTVGSQLYFAPGRYDPHSAHGQRLLGHELAHVVQQRTGLVRNPFGSGLAVVQDPSLEAAADRMALRAAMAPEPVPRVVAPPAPSLQLRPAPHGQAPRGSLDRYLPVPGVGAPPFGARPDARPAASGVQLKPISPLHALSTARPPGQTASSQVVQPFGLLEGLGVGALAVAGVVGIGYGLYSLYQWYTQRSPGYYVKILTRPGLMSEGAIQQADGTLNMLEERFLSKRDNNGQPKPSHRPMRRGTWLSDIDPNGKLHIIGHGIPEVDETTRVPQYASLLSGYTAAEVADMLVDDYRLPNDFRGSIVMLVCHSGSNTGHRSLAEDLLYEIRQRGPHPTSIKALLGTGTVDEDTGRTVVRSDASVGAFDRWIPLWRELIEMKDNLSSYDRSEHVKLFSKAMRDPAVNELMPGETKRKLLDWMKENQPFSTKRALQETAKFIRDNRRIHMQYSATHKVVYN